MINEEKAQRIIGDGCDRTRCLECGGSLSVEKGCEHFQHIMQMAEWKEQQMIDKL